MDLLQYNSKQNVLRGVRRLDHLAADYQTVGLKLCRLVEKLGPFRFKLTEDLKSTLELIKRRLCILHPPIKRYQKNGRMIKQNTDPKEWGKEEVEQKGWEEEEIGKPSLDDNPSSSLCDDCEMDYESLETLSFAKVYSLESSRRARPRSSFLSNIVFLKKIIRSRYIFFPGT